jgi:hypothetical protein
MSMTWGRDDGGSASPQAATEPVPVPVTDVPLRRPRDRKAFERFMAAWEAEVLERIRSRGEL